MGIFHLSRRAEDDFLSIAAFTLDRWGADQANRYLTELESCCRQIADMPALGRAADEVRPDLRRYEYGKHVIYYREGSNGILVSRASSIKACWPTGNPTTTTKNQDIN